MFDDRIKKGIVFRIDADAAKKFSLTEKSEWAVSRDATAVEVRASKFKDGKPARGRPRKFPTSDVARMLGITDLPTPAADPVVTPTDVADDTAEDEARASSLIAGVTPTPVAASDSDQAPW